MKRYLMMAAAVAACVFWATAGFCASEQPKCTIKIATLAPEGTAWMRKFNELSQRVLEETGGAVRLKAYPGGVLGGEKDVLFKIKVGQVDGGGFMGLGVCSVCPDADALMQPLVFRSYEEVDAAFEALRPGLEAQCRRNGFVALGWTEIGFCYAYSAVPVRSLDDLRGAKPWLLAGSETFEALFKRGNVSGIPVPVSDVLTALQTGLLRTVFAPPYAAVATQWFTRVKYRNDAKLLYTLGGLFVTERAWDKIPADLREKVSALSHQMMADLSQEVRRSNTEAIDVMAKQGIETVTCTDEGMQAFVEVSRQVIEDRSIRKFSDESFATVQARIEAMRAGRPQ